MCFGWRYECNMTERKKERGKEKGQTEKRRKLGKREKQTERETGIKALPSEDLQHFSWQHHLAILSIHRESVHLMLGPFESFLWVPEGCDRHTAPNTHTPSWATIWSPCNAVLQLCAQPSAAFAKAECPQPSNDAQLGTPRLSHGCSFLCLSCFVTLPIGLFMNASYPAAPLKKILKGLPQKAMGITIKPGFYIAPLFLNAYGVFTSIISSWHP